MQGIWKHRIRHPLPKHSRIFFRIGALKIQWGISNESSPFLPSKNSINSNTPIHLCTMQYQTFDTTIPIIHIYEKVAYQQKQIQKMLSNIPLFALKIYSLQVLEQTVNSIMINPPIRPQLCIHATCQKIQFNTTMDYKKNIHCSLLRPHS